MHKKNISVSNDFTKIDLINKILEYWDSSFGGDKTTFNNQAASCDSTQFPIHLLARKFSEWFFANYNTGGLKLEDFWSDANISLRIVANDGIDDRIGSCAIDVIEILVRCKSQFGFFFNPNLNQAGVQGRMSPHGLVLIVVCGTLHTQCSCVGVFECTFGVMRDPYSENNWKIKTIQCMLQSQSEPATPCLAESTSLKEILSLPETADELP